MPTGCPHECKGRTGFPCTGCGGGPCLHCGGGGGGGEFPRAERSLLMARGTWERLKRRAGEGAFLDARPTPPMPPPGEGGCGCAPSPEEHARHLREESRAMRLRMSNVGLKNSLYARLVAQRGERTRAQAARREQLLASASAERASERKAFIENCRQLLRATNIHGVRELDSALRFTEVLRERNAQVAFNARLRNEVCDRQRKWFQQLRADWAHQDALQAARTQERECERQEYRKDLLQQLHENAKCRNLEKQEIHREREQLDLVCREALNAEARRKELAMKRKQEFRSMLQETIADQQRHCAMLQRESCEQDRINAVACDVQQKIRRAGMRKIKERVQAFMCASDKIGQRIWAAHQDDIRKLQEEEMRRKKRQEELERQWCKRQEAEVQRKACNAAIKRESYREYCQAQAARCAAARCELARLAGLREKQVLFVKELEEQEKALLKKKQGDARANYDKQVAEKRALMTKVHAEEMKHYTDKLNAWKNEDAHFFNYANQLLQEAQCKGRLPLPFHRVIYQYKKVYGLLPRPCRVNTLKSPARW